MTEHELTFRCMGTDVRLLAPDRAGLDDARAWLASFDARLSRFRDDSELCALNRDRRSTVPASALLRTAVSAGLWAAQRTEGLVDPTVLPAPARRGLRRLAGRGGARRPGGRPSPWHRARRVARPHPAARWRRVHVDDAHGTVRRPPGIELDTGGTGKGLAADARRAPPAAHASASRWTAAVTCASAATAAQRTPYEVEVAHPFGGEPVAPAVAGPRRDRHLGHRLPTLATTRRDLRAPPHRPPDRRAGVDRAS